jgi:gas vesicle protein
MGREAREDTMARDEGAGAGSILLAFILGAVSGAAVALLYAPAAGKDTRDYLNDKARDLSDKARDARERASAAAAAAAEQGREVMKEGRETLATAIDRGREAYQQARARERA